jgi:hypothetical protein
MKKTYNNPLTEVMPLIMHGHIMETTTGLGPDPMRRRDPIP